MPHRKCLEIFGRWLRTQHARRIVVVVYVRGTPGGKDAAYVFFGNDRIWLMTQNAGIIFVVVYVRGILGVPDAT